MQILSKRLYLGAAVLAVSAILAATSPHLSARAQTTTPPASTSSALPETTIKTLQEALNKQGISVKADGILSDETRAAIKKYQSQHHLPITGEPDKATLDKIGVSARSQPTTIAQATPTPPASSSTPQAQAPSSPTPQGPMQPGQMQSGMMMDCPMMQGPMMQSMMQMMQGMTQMMQTMQMMHAQMQQGQMQRGMMQPGQTQPGQMQPGQMQPGTR